MKTTKYANLALLLVPVLFGFANAAIGSNADRPLRHASFSGQELRRDEQGRPNIIFIFGDDWGYGDLSLHGSNFVKTPHIDRMAAAGIDF